MRPAPHEIIAAVRDLLRESIAPEVTSEEGQLALRKIMAVLRDVRWDDLVLALVRENRELEAMAEAAGSWISSDPERNKGWQALLSEVRDVTKAVDQHYYSFENLQKANASLRTALCYFVSEVAASRPGDSSDREALESLRGDFARRLAALARVRSLRK